MKRTGAVLILIACLLVSGSAFADAVPQEKISQEESPRCLESIEVLIGYSLAKLRQKGSYKGVPIYLDFGFALKPLTRKIGFNPPMMLQFIVEPFIMPTWAPKNNVEIGNNFLIKIGFVPETWSFQPYFKGGLGLLYMTQHTVEQSTQFNFNEYAGIGAHYFFNKNLAFTLEYRFRHLSNGSIKSPNTGINSNIAVCGLTYRY